jgi:hypothetical protein
MRGFALQRKRCALWADLGLGKTPTALEVIRDSLNDYCDTERWLVVAPRLVALDAWPRQLNRWAQFAGLSYRNITAADFGLQINKAEPTQGRKHQHLIFGDRADKAAVKRRLQGLRETIHLVSWDMLPYLVKAYGVNWPYDGIVLDEAVFAANSTSERHKAAYHVIHRLGAVNRVIQLTGAPVPNGYAQLHGQARLLDRELLGDTLTEFQRRWMTPVPMGSFLKWVMRADSRPAMDALMAQYAISLKSADYLSLPELTINRVTVDLPGEARELYDRMERDLVADVDGVEILAPSQAALAGKLLQIANGAIYDESGAWSAVHRAKLDRLDELLEIAPGPVLLAYSYAHDWERIKAKFKGTVHVKDHGALDRFRAGKVKLLGMHPASGAHGLDGLQEVSSTAVWFGATYNADHWAQFNKRLHRDGQKAGRVTIHQILASDTLEDHLAVDVLPAKLEEQDVLLQAVKMRLSSVAQCH